MTFSKILFPKSEKSLGYKDFQSSATLAWEAVVLPIYEPCVAGERIITDLFGKFKPFLTNGVE